ncbi:MAG: hypothetical protein FJ027_20135 [Candidatus Rokubacteria bacterium]|nr:hypothetical protein [Candidatus Rokubacteria bacterium]
MLAKPFVLLLIVLASTGCVGGGGLGKVLSSALTPEDVQRGKEIAAAAHDVAGVNCADALLAQMSEAQTLELHAVGIFSAFMKVRELRRRANAPPDETVQIACAPLYLDAQRTILKLGLSAAPGGGALGGVLGR